MVVREWYCEAGRTPPSDEDIDELIDDAKQRTDGPLTIRNLKPFVRRWLRPWTEVHAMIEDAATSA